MTDNDLCFYDPRDPDTGFLSNFHRSPFLLGEVLYPTVEHAYQAAKFSDAEYAERIRNAESPRAAKTLGQARDVVLRPDWDAVKQAEMLRLIAAKFCLGVNDQGLPALLLATGKKRLIEASPTDAFWGAGSDGKGENHLGVCAAEA